MPALMYLAYTLIIKITMVVIIFQWDIIIQIKITYLLISLGIIRQNFLIACKYF
jgi:hypothetical protein